MIIIKIIIKLIKREIFIAIFFCVGDFMSKDWLTRIGVIVDSLNNLYEVFLNLVTITMIKN